MYCAPGVDAFVSFLAFLALLGSTYKEINISHLSWAGPDDCWIFHLLRPHFIRIVSVVPLAPVYPYSFKYHNKRLRVKYS